MSEHHFEIAIIGAGTAGMRAYREASKLASNIAIIESGDFGTTCARVGCMPSKLLIAPAEARHSTERFQAFGLEKTTPKVDKTAVMTRVRAERDRFVGFVVEAVEGFDATLYKAHARFKDAHTLELSDGQTLTADKIVIATGSRPNIPALFDQGCDRIITNDEVFDWTRLPEKIAVVGAGVIGLELAQALHRLDVDVTLLGHNNSIGPLGDPEVKAYALQTFSEALRFYGHAEISEVTVADKEVTLGYKKDANCDDMTHETFEYVLMATGRRPNIDALNIENADLVLDKRGIPEYDPLSSQCGDSHIFIAGDVTADLPLLHEAADEGAMAGENAARFPQVYRKPRKTPIGVVFCDPQMAVVGESFQALTQSETDFATGSVSFEDQGRSRVMLVNKGLLKVYGEQCTGRLLGAEMIGPSAEHLAHLLAWSIQRKETVQALLEMPFYHPVIEEGLRTALRDLHNQLHMGPPPPKNCLDCGPGS